MTAMDIEGKRFPFIPFIINLSIPLIFGASSKYFSRDAINNWFASVQKPEIFPSLEISVTMIIVLYIIIGISSFVVWRQRKSIKNYSGVICLYFTQLLLHFTWRVTYFNQGDFLLGLYLMTALLIIVIINGVVFYRISKLAGLLFIPYVLWISFIMFLIYSIYIIN